MSNHEQRVDLPRGVSHDHEPASRFVTDERQLEFQELSFELLERMAAQLAQERQDAIEKDIKLPLGFVFSGGVENFPAKEEKEMSGLLILAAGYISRVDSHSQLEKIFDMMKVQVDNA